MSGSCIELALRVCLLLWTVALGGCTAYFAARRGEDALRRGNDAGAIQAFAEARRASPRYDARWRQVLAAASRRLVQQGDAAGRQGDLNAATSAYDKAVAYDQERGAEHTEARARLRAVHLEWTEAQAQIDHARNLINRGPNPALLEEAIGSLRPLLRLTPTFNNVPVLLEDAIRKRVSLHVKVIRQALARGAAMEARQELARAKDWGSQDAAVVEDLRRAEDEVAAQEDAQQGASYLKEGRLAEAAAHLGRALQRDPHNPVARSKLPEAQRRHGRQVQEGVRSLLRARHYSAAVDRCREGVAAAPYLQAACEGVLQPAERALAKRLSESAERARRSSLPGAVWAYERLVELLPAAFGLPDRQPDRKLPDLGPLLDYDIEVVADPQSTPELAAQVLGPLSQRLAVELAPRRVYVVIGSAPGSQRPQLVFALTSLRMEHPPPVPEERVQAYIRGYDYPENPKWAQKRKECIELTLKYRAFEPRVAQAGAIGAELTRRRQEVEARKSAIGATLERERWTEVAQLNAQASQQDQIATVYAEKMREIRGRIARLHQRLEATADLAERWLIRQQLTQAEQELEREERQEQWTRRNAQGVRHRAQERTWAPLLSPERQSVESELAQARGAEQQQALDLVALNSQRQAAKDAVDQCSLSLSSIQPRLRVAIPGEYRYHVLRHEQSAAVQVSIRLADKPIGIGRTILDEVVPVRYQAGVEFAGAHVQGQPDLDIPASQPVLLSRDDLLQRLGAALLERGVNVAGGTLRNHADRFVLAASRAGKDAQLHFRVLTYQGREFLSHAEDAEAAAQALLESTGLDLKHDRVELKRLDDR